MPADLGALGAVFSATMFTALGAFSRADCGTAVALDGDIRYRPKT
jgi:hypothetical protein